MTIGKDIEVFRRLGTEDKVREYAETLDMLRRARQKITELQESAPERVYIFHAPGLDTGPIGTVHKSKEAAKEYARGLQRQGCWEIVERTIWKQKK